MKNDMELELKDLLEKYESSFSLLDDYDHQSLKDIKGNEAIYILSYQECRDVIDSLSFYKTSSIFGREKENGKLEGIIKGIYQNVYGVEQYPSLEDKAAHLLYFLIKDHPFVDGCKRIGATLFVYFLNKNHHLYKNNELIISNAALATLTLLVAESNPSEMDYIIKIIKAIL